MDVLSLSNAGVKILLGIVALVFVIEVLRICIRAIVGRKGNKKNTPTLKREIKNPIISPMPQHSWSAQGTFNPAAYFDGEKTHIIYRAIGEDGVSRLGYAASEDGINFDDRSVFPVFSMRQPRLHLLPSEKTYDRAVYASGGSWGGCEDPRIVKIGKRLYVTFSAFDGWDYIRIGVISILEKDFLAQKWNWTRPLLISPEEKINKNWVLFPEKIKGKFAILNSLVPDIQISYVDRLEDLDFGIKKVESNFKNAVSRKEWDTYVRGAGPPPLRTEKGWLVLYHAIDKAEPNKYKIGAMLLDLKDPSKIISRANAPILVPDEWYENDWKPGVVYACGAVIKDDTLYVYYGGGDKYICVAHISLPDLLKFIMI